MFASLCVSLILTVIIETILAILVKIRDKDNLSTIAWINCLTNPIVVYLVNMSSLLENDMISTVVLLVLEVIVIPVEGALLKRKIKKDIIRPYLLALYLNVLSFLVGVVINLVIKYN